MFAVKEIPDKKFCIPEAECTATTEGYYFIEKTYSSGNTRKYCISCPENCNTCNDNIDCLTCYNSFSTFNAGTKTCDCGVANCRYCVNSACEVCTNDTDLVQITRAGVYTCEAPSGLASNCNSGYGIDTSVVLAPGESTVCRQCSNEDCNSCFSDYTICDDCVAGEVPFNWSEHPDPAQSSNPVSCEPSGTPKTFYFFNSAIATFERCQTPPQAACETCTALDVCTSCDPAYVHVGSSCVTPGALSCRSPEVLSSVSSNCENCSTDYSNQEVAEPGLCSAAKSFEVTDVTESNFHDKSRNYKFTSDYFNEDFPLTEEIVNNNFQFALNEGTITAVNLISIDTVSVEFDNFSDDLQLTVSLKNATLVETFISETQSDAIKILIDNSFTFDIENFTTYNEEVLAATATTGKVLGNSNLITEKSGIAISIFTIFANVRISGAMLKAIQIIILFDKMRFVNVEFGGLMGYFLDVIFKAFDSSVLKRDNYTDSTISNYN
jgi:hypothetical protein